MEGLIVSYRRGRHGQTPNHAIAIVDGVKDREAAAKLVGKRASWKSIQTSIPGEVSSAHGNKGAIRIVFSRGLPGQAINQKVALE